MSPVKGRKARDDAEVVLGELSADALVNYSGEWVAFGEGRILGHGPRLKELVSNVNAKGGSKEVRYLPVPSTTGAY